MGEYPITEDRLAEAIKSPEILNSLISDYRPFIARVIRNHIGHFVAEGRDEELSIGMLAFEEAVRTYEPAKGNFLSYSERIIRWRLIDYYRKNRQWQKRVSLDAMQEAHGREAWMNSQSQENYQRETEQRQMTAEILEFREAINQFGFDFKELADHSPKQEKIKKLLRDTAEEICRDPRLLEKLLKAGKIPVNEILNRGWIDKKRMERGRLYIIACVIVLSGDYEMIHDYLGWR